MHWKKVFLEKLQEVEAGFRNCLIYTNAMIVACVLCAHLRKYHDSAQTIDCMEKVARLARRGRPGSLELKTIGYSVRPVGLHCGHRVLHRRISTRPETA